MKSFKSTSTRINKADLSRYNLSTNNLASYSNPLSLVKDVKETIENICIIHFGVRSGLLDEVLIESVIQTIISKFKSLTTKDLMSAFERIEVKSNNWKNITKRDLIEPIQNWWNKKEEIRLEFEKYQKELSEKEEAERKEEEFKNLAIDTYRKSIVCAEWLGDIFQANAIYKIVLRQIQLHKKNELWQEAQVQKNKQDALHEKDPSLTDLSNYGMTAKRIFGELIVIEGIKQKIRI